MIELNEELILLRN